MALSRAAGDRCMYRIVVFRSSWPSRASTVQEQPERIPARRRTMRRTIRRRGIRRHTETSTDEEAVLGSATPRLPCPLPVRLRRKPMVYSQASDATIPRSLSPRMPRSFAFLPVSAWATATGPPLSLAPIFSDIRRAFGGSRRNASWSNRHARRWLVARFRETLSEEGPRVRTAKTWSQPKGNCRRWGNGVDVSRVTLPLRRPRPRRRWPPWLWARRRT